MRTADPRIELKALSKRLLRPDRADRPIERHGRLADLFILASELAQGLADAEMAEAGGDRSTPGQAAATALLMILARKLLASWTALGLESVAADADDEDVRAASERLLSLPLPTSVQMKSAEGYAFYALYPEAYAEAARTLSGGAGVTVLGVRSIGLGLAAVAAVALGARPPLSVRPVGPPFQRRLQVTPELEAELRILAGGRFVVVDEGPGLSGSSFGAVADALETLGVARERISFLPGHGGDLGPQASASHRARWRAAERPCVDFDALVMKAQAPGCRLASWFPDLCGDGVVRLRDLSGGAWRALRDEAEAEWPAADTFQERRKLLLETQRGGWLLKFVGLGDAGRRAFDCARRLGDAGFTPAPAALRYGFMAEPWRSDGWPLRLEAANRHAFAMHLGRYLGWRAAHLPAPPTAGADMAKLVEMARVNATEALGEGARRMSLFDDRRWADAPPPRPVWTDNRLHRHEWLELGDGWLKTDAVDHAAAHDLVGAQDIAWDVAGARIEFDLDAAETATLLAALRPQAEVEPALITLMEPAYAAFQLGAYTMAAAAHAAWPQERARLEREAERYCRRLAHLLGMS